MLGQHTVECEDLSSNHPGGISLGGYEPHAAIEAVQLDADSIEYRREGVSIDKENNVNDEYDGERYGFDKDRVPPSFIKPAPNAVGVPTVGVAPGSEIVPLKPLYVMDGSWVGQYPPPSPCCDVIVDDILENGNPYDIDFDGDGVRGVSSDHFLKRDVLDSFIVQILDDNDNSPVFEAPVEALNTVIENLNNIDTWDYPVPWRNTKDDLILGGSNNDIITGP